MSLNMMVTTRIIGGQIRKEKPASHCKFSATYIVIIDYPFLIYPEMILVVAITFKSTQHKTFCYESYKLQYLHNPMQLLNNILK